MDSASARQLSLAPTGHASRGTSGAPGVSASNVHLEAGAISPADLMLDVGEGVYVTELFGHGINAVTGDYSRGATGFRIVDGELAGPIAEFTVAGNAETLRTNSISGSGCRNGGCLTGLKILIQVKGKKYFTGPLSVVPAAIPV